MESFEHVACTICGCVCDDLRITVEAGRISKCEGACCLSEPWFLAQDSRRPPVALIDGRPAPLDEAVGRAAELLRAACSPLIYGLSRSSTEGQRAAIALAERVGATIDTTASNCHAPSVMAIQEVGESTCTLGEVKNRADLVIFWGSNPVESHPRHLERYSLQPRGRFVPTGRAGRTLVVVDVKPTATSGQADLFLRVEPGKDFEALNDIAQPGPRCTVGSEILDRRTAESAARSGRTDEGMPLWDRFLRPGTEHDGPRPSQCRGATLAGSRSERLYPLLCSQDARSRRYYWGRNGPPLADRLPF
jgi:hypothetical protein